MFKKVVMLGVVGLLLLAMTVPVSAMLKVLDPQVSEELRGIARQHLIQKENIPGDAIYIQEGWVRSLWGIGVDVYMVVTVINKGLATEREIQVPVRVDQKIVLSEAEMTALVNEDYALDSNQQVARALTLEDSAEQPAETAGNTIYYLIAGGAAILLLLGTGFAIKRFKTRSS